MTGSGRDEWSDDMFAEMARMFEQMGMSIDIKALEAMMNQIREQFETMGIDPTKMSHSHIKIDTNTDPEEFRRVMESMLNDPDRISELLENMGVNIRLNGPGEVEAKAEETEEPKVSDLPEEDVYTDDGRMSVTIDISKFLDIGPEDVELVLSSGGEVLQLMRKTQARPFKRLILPQAAGQIVEWELNNGILDITFDLV